MSRLGILDYLHRAIVYTCVAVSIGGIGVAEIIAEREALGLPLEPPKTDEQKEQDLAALAAQTTLLPSRNQSS
ncbi:hypothetical protein CC2G_008647 [Coprinopsis cinerea AmutBmut pab1-1]|nr:hypothetical protein CC2G_008647 [Coprinopsis cinerea AmutBmut pab1-1]